jgi:hypothetical protein
LPSCGGRVRTLRGARQAALTGCRRADELLTDNRHTAVGYLAGQTRLGTGHALRLEI